VSVRPRDALPVDSFLPEIVRLTAGNRITLLEAEPGAGKTTRVPPALLAAGLGPVYVLEPRRLAARMAARRVAAELGEELGGTVGYRVRFEEISSARTRLWFCTEGVLVRSLLHGRELDAGVVVLDEFHERHLETDTALALLRERQRRQSSLRVLIMSATLGGEAIRRALGSPPLLKVPGKTFPVAIEYTPHSAAPLEDRVAAAAEKTLAKTAGHLLVFLPGAAEIRRSMQACEAFARRYRADVLALHGDLSASEQDRVLAPSSARKIICSTNVAESSVTVDGVEAVIDSGLARVRTHSPWSGFARIHVQKISRSSAVQRAGRAGRTAPGLAIRLYSEAEFVRFADHLPPEIERADLSELALMLAAHGMQPEDLPWLDALPEHSLSEARSVLARLLAFGPADTLTEFGRSMARLPLHPRLACFALRAAEMGAREIGCDLAARLSEDRLRYDPQQQAQAASDLDVLLGSPSGESARRLKARLLRAIPPTQSREDRHASEKALLLAYPDRVARRRQEQLLLAGGGSARLDRASSVQSEFVVALDVDDRSSTSMPLVRLATHIEPDWLLEFFPDRIRAREELVWNRQAERVEQVQALVYDELVIDESSGPPADREQAARLLARKAAEAGVAKFADEDTLRRLLLRARFAARFAGAEIAPELLEDAIEALAQGLTSFAELRIAAEGGALLALLQTKLPMRVVDEYAPSHVPLANGRRAPIEYYEDDKPPSVSSRLQDFFGMRQTPAVARGAIPLTVHLLAPNRRPVQVTTDLESFWRTLYPQVRRELSRRYPKHAWPEVPG
jgi:ATP-dependent helicase HrpB